MSNFMIFSERKFMENLFERARMRCEMPLNSFRQPEFHNSSRSIRRASANAKRTPPKVQFLIDRYPFAPPPAAVLRLFKLDSSMSTLSLKRGMLTRNRAEDRPKRRLYYRSANDARTFVISSWGTCMYLYYVYISCPSIRK